MPAGFIRIARAGKATNIEPVGGARHRDIEEPAIFFLRAAAGVLKRGLDHLRPIAT